MFFTTGEAGDYGSIPGLGRSPGRGHGNPLQYSCVENPMDRGAWWATVHGVVKIRTQLSDWADTHFYQQSFHGSLGVFVACTIIRLQSRIHMFSVCYSNTPLHSTKIYIRLDSLPEQNTGSEPSARDYMKPEFLPQRLHLQAQSHLGLQHMHLPGDTNI